MPMTLATLMLAPSGAEGPDRYLKMTMENYYAAMAAELIDSELQWRLERLPEPGKQSKLDQAILREAELRGLLKRYSPREDRNSQRTG